MPHTHAIARSSMMILAICTGTPLHGTLFKFKVLTIQHFHTVPGIILPHDIPHKVTQDNPAMASKPIFSKTRGGWGAHTTQGFGKISSNEIFP